jgi:S-adenosyl-L-methionine hydrolase (adenosine-forming)
MVVIFTDYGYQGPYLGQIYSVLEQYAPEVRIITLLADAPRFKPKASAYLLRAITSNFPAGTVFFSVVDPGVGSNIDRPIIMEIDKRFYVGPDNGLFDLVARINSNIKTWYIDWKPEYLSNTFHGRDLYAPICGMLANKKIPTRKEFQWVDQHNWQDDLYEIIHIDHFGNAMTGIRANKLDGGICMEVSGHLVNSAQCFSDVKPGVGFWYENSFGLVEFAVNQGRANVQLEIEVGEKITIN